MVNIIPDSQIIRWHELAAVIEASGDLNTTDIQYIQYFKVVYHCFARDIFPGNDTNVQEAVKILKKRAANLSSSKSLKEDLKSFLAISNIAMSSEASFRQFRADLKSKGWLPPVLESEEQKRKASDANELLRRYLEEKERLAREERERQRRKQAEEERRRREAERQERERMERWQREREMEAARREAKALRRNRIIFGCVAAVAVVIGLAFGIPYYIHNVVEYNELLRESDRLVAEYKFSEAISCVKEARDLRSSERTKSELNTRIHDISAAKYAKIRALRTDISNVWSAYFSGKNLKTSVLRYVSKSEIEPVIKAQEANINLLDSITENTSENTWEFHENMQKLNKLKRYYKL